MTRGEAKEWLPIIQAWAEGKPIQYQTDSRSWSDINKDLYTSNPPSNYRIKPEPKYRPFKAQEECWNEMLKHQPFGWVMNENGDYSCLLSINKYFEDKDFSYMFKTYRFVDATPFGIKEVEL